MPGRQIGIGSPASAFVPAEQGFPGKQIGVGSPDSAFVPAEQGFPGKQIGIGSPDNSFVPTGQLTPGLHGGMGPDDRAATPNAVPKTNNKNRSIIFAFMCLSSAAVAAMHTDSKRRSDSGYKMPVMYAISGSQFRKRREIIITFRK